MKKNDDVSQPTKKLGRLPATKLQQRNNTISGILLIPNDLLRTVVPSSAPTEFNLCSTSCCTTRASTTKYLVWLEINQVFLVCIVLAHTNINALWLSQINSTYQRELL
jgi:hypothetical protein